MTSMNLRDFAVQRCFRLPSAKRDVSMDIWIVCAVDRPHPTEIVETGPAELIGNWVRATGRVVSPTWSSVSCEQMIKWLVVNSSRRGEDFSTICVWPLKHAGPAATRKFTKNR